MRREDPGTFTNAHFVHRSVLLSDVGSIEDAIHLAKQPIFGPAARSLVICLDDTPPLHEGPGFSTLTLSKQKRAQLGGLSDVMMHRLACKSTNAALNALTVLLARLQKHVTGIIITDIPTLKSAGQSAPIITHASCEYLQTPDANDRRRFYSIILEALALSEIHVEELCINQVNLSFEPHYFADEDMGSEVLKSVKSLVIETCVEVGSIQSNIQSFVRAVANAPLLQNLELKVASSYHRMVEFDDDLVDGSILVQLITLQRFDKLERLTIRGASLSVRGLAVFARQQTSLRYLALHGTCIQDYEQVIPDDEDMGEAIKRLSGLKEVEVGESFA